MGLYDRILVARGASAAAELVRQVGALEQAYLERRQLLSEAGRRLDAVEQQFQSLDGGSARRPAGAWTEAPDPDRAALEWFDFVVGEAGPAAVRPLLERYRSLGWITAQQHSWFSQLALFIVPPGTSGGLPGEAKVIESIDARTRALMGRLRAVAG